MNNGFSIEIQKNLSKEDRKCAELFADNFISKTLTNNWNFLLKGGGGYHSYLRRGRFGMLLLERNYYSSNAGGMDYIKSKTEGARLVFRRIARNRRVFGIVDCSTLVTYPNKKEVSLKKCVCPKCLGMERVTWREDRPKTYTYCTIGKIKG